MTNFTDDEFKNDILPRLTDSQKRQIYDELTKQYYHEDAVRHLEDIVENYDEDSATYKNAKRILANPDKIDALVDIFEDNLDCNVAENDTWESTIAYFES